MDIIVQLTSELTRLQGLSSANPVPVTFAEPQGRTLELMFHAVDRIGCSLNQIRLTAPQLAGKDIDELREWAEALCRKITYLTEQLGPLEVDALDRKVLIRSTPPDRSGDETRFYEILLQTLGGGQFSLKRYATEKNPPSRDQVEIALTHETLKKLVQDLWDLAAPA
ncbi:MAG: hypothetical protein WEB58_18255 [Planctomycetaceae bacterium]